MSPASVAVGGASRPRPSLRWLVAVGRALAPHPTLWPTAIAQLRRLAPRGWWRRPPYLPVPASDYLAFRSQTMYGDAARLPEPADVVTFVHWCRAFPRVPRTGGVLRTHRAIAPKPPR